MNIPLTPSPQGPYLEFNASALVEEISKDEELTFYKALENFKTEFVSLEDFITKGNSPKYNIVFIDDLDRCEPEQVLNLLSAIKLFFTYGEKTIFFCGIDKKAVEQAVKTKYGEIVKANEYLEKIFDVSFSMPEHDDILKLVSVYFDDREIKLGKFEGKLNEKIAGFFRELNFTNPRRVKKVLNKYLILSNFKTILKDNKYKDVIPNIYVDEDGNFFETILTLYFLCLFEYDKDAFEIFNDLSLKKQAIKLAIERGNSFSQKDISSQILSIKDLITSENFELSFMSLHNKYTKGEGSQGQSLDAYKNRVRMYFCMHFVNGNDSEFTTSFLFDDQHFQRDYRVSTKKIDYFFSRYLLDNFQYLIQSENLSNFSLSKFKDMLGKLL